MAAYWHIALPVKIGFLKTKENQVEFNEKYEDGFAPVKKTSKTNKEVVYTIEKEILQSEFYLLLKDLYTEWELQHKKIFKDKINIEEKDLLDETLLKLESVQIKNLEKENVRIISDASNNYIYFTMLVEWVTYKGFPLSDEFTIDVVSFLRGDNKIQEEPEEEKKLIRFLDYFQKKYNDKYCLTKYLFVAGF